MSPASSSKIISKLQKLTEYIGYLKHIKKNSNPIKFVSNFELFGLAERYLQLAIECTMDIGKLVLIELNLPRASNNHELFEILYQEKIISKKLFERLKGIAGFRNILVHDYEKIDRNIVYQNLISGLKDFSDFQKAIKKAVL